MQIASPFSKIPDTALAGMFQYEFFIFFHFLQWKSLMLCVISISHVSLLYWMGAVVSSKRQVLYWCGVLPTRVDWAFLYLELPTTVTVCYSATIRTKQEVLSNSVTIKEEVKHFVEEHLSIRWLFSTLTKCTCTFFPLWGFTHSKWNYSAAPKLRLRTGGMQVKYVSGQMHVIRKYQ